MDRRLAAIAGGVLAAAGAIGMFSRRHAPVSIDPIETDVPLADTAATDDVPEGGTMFYVSQGWSPDTPFDLGQAGMTLAAGRSAELPSPFYAVPEVQEEPEPAPVRPLSEILCELVSGYSMDADKLLVLRMALRPIGDALEAGTLEEGTALVDFDWSPGSGLVMNLVTTVLATRSYVRINVCDLAGNLRAPELDVHIRGDDVRVLPDTTARTVDLDERRSEALVTSLKLKAIQEGVAIHPGSASAVLARCRIGGTPFTN